jgi:two-component system sensor histidine kinase YesM
MKIRFWPVRNVITQLIASFLLLTLIILTASLGLLYTLVLDILQKRSEDATIQLFRQAEYSIVQFRSEIEQLSKLILVEPKVQEYLEDIRLMDEVSRIELEGQVGRRLSQMLNSYSYLDSIYLYLESGTVIEVMNNRQLVTDDHKFKGSPLYQMGKEHYPNLWWVGANTPSLFAIYPYANTSKTEPTLLSAIRGIKPLMGKEQTGTLVLNVNEQALANIFGNLHSTPGSAIYMTDSIGVVISEMNKQNLGTRSTYFGEIPQRTQYGSFTSSVSGKKKQLVYYSIGESGWTLIKEIPFEEFLKDTRKIQWSVIAIIIASVLVSFILIFYLIRIITRPLRELTNAMMQLEKGQLGSTIRSLPNNEFGRLGRHFNRMSRSIVELVEHNKRIEYEKSVQEMKTLQSQIHPHFLYNTLNSLKMMAQMVHATNVVEGITTLGVILKGVFKAEGPLCTLEEEIYFTSNYVKIMNYRYGERVTFLVDAPERLHSYKVLRFLFQPIVENAFQHGFTEGFYTGVIKLDASQQDDQLIIVISDTGKGMDGQELERIQAKLHEMNIDHMNDGTGIGLWNVYHRLSLHFKEACQLKVESTKDEGTRVTIVLPIL